MIYFGCDLNGVDGARERLRQSARACSDLKQRYSSDRLFKKCNSAAAIKKINLYNKNYVSPKSQMEMGKLDVHSVFIIL